jgi:peptide-methionine (S)-S-oxide reductase
MTPTPAAIRDYDERAPDSDDTETATFALGCFWGPEAAFGALAGVVRTRVGYAGGTTQNPTYHALGDHTECFQVDYVPSEVTFTDLLGRVFQRHNPNRQPASTQYQNVVFAATASQREAIDAFLDSEGLDADAIETRVERLSQFYLAEAYHQKHSLRAHPRLVEGVEDAGYDDGAIRESPAAAKLNALAAGHDPPAEDALAQVASETGPYR